MKGRDPVPGPATAYLQTRARAAFCLDSFLALREATALQLGLPPLEGWFLKRGDAFTFGQLNSWRARYFRLEGPELVYYEVGLGWANRFQRLRLRDSRSIEEGCTC